jgi:hypothetical protein
LHCWDSVKFISVNMKIPSGNQSIIHQIGGVQRVYSFLKYRRQLDLSSCIHPAAPKELASVQNTWSSANTRYGAHYPISRTSSVSAEPSIFQKAVDHFCSFAM